VNQLQATDKKIGDSYEQQVIVVNEPAGIPGHHKDAARHHDTEYFNQAVKKKVTVEAGYIEPEENHNPDENDSRLPGNKRSPLHDFSLQWIA
jgi:hypothetical protein